MATLRPGILARLLPLVYVFNGTLTLVGGFSPIWLGRTVGLTLLAAGVVWLVSVQFASISVDADGITHRWFRTTRWRWADLSGLGWRPPLDAWMLRPTGGRWRRLARWVVVRPQARRKAVQDFCDALVHASEAAGIRTGPVPRHEVSIWR